MGRSLKTMHRRGLLQLGDLKNPSLEAGVLLCHAAGVSWEILLAHPERQISQEREKCFWDSIARRKRGVPLAYITGEKEFWSLPFQVSPGVLIPRPETETLVECAADAVSVPNPVIFDIGTGSGNVAVALAKRLPQAEIFAGDISYTALITAKKNAAALGAEGLLFFQGNLFDPLKNDRRAGLFDLVVSNPPYLSETDWLKIDPGIRDFEPKEALVSGSAGLECIRKIIQAAPFYLKPRGHLCLEVGYGQAGGVERLFGRDWEQAQTRRDLAGIPRVVYARRRKGSAAAS
ncbi:MAG: peptide chain release factor N(5)-glutamine methyltransferase [Candidatus Aminicenantes bacterium]